MEPCLKVSPMSEVSVKTLAAKMAHIDFAQSSTSQKNLWLELLSNLLLQHQDLILEANALDVEASKSHLSEALLDRLTLNPKRIQAMAQGCLDLALLPDPIGVTLETLQRPNGLNIRKVSVPLGVLAIIYESRPNVTVDAACLCLKAGNSVILRGGKEALHSNQVLVDIIKQSLEKAHLNPEVLQFITDSSRELALELMQAHETIDALIPRGSHRLIQSVLENARVPVIETGTGNCHIYVESSADLKMAQAILINAKCSRPGVCNAAEKCLIDASIAQAFLTEVVPLLMAQGVELRGCEQATQLNSNIHLASAEDWSTEYLDLILGIKIVQGIDEAITHIERYGSHHSEAIITQNDAYALKFQTFVDAAAVYVNASTRFTDGYEFGFGAELGISTQKLHARGPMGLKELTTYKYLIQGNGQIR